MAIVIKITNENIKSATDAAAEILKNGGTCIFPTETVYGLGANALDKNVADKIYKAKGRPSDNPLIVHISNKEQLKDLVKNISKRAEILMKSFWPGPLTMIFNKSEIIPYTTTGGLDTVAIRFPSHKIAQKIISKSNLPIAAPSANISGRPSLTDEENLVKEMSDNVDMIVLSENSDIGLESTVIDTTEEKIKILRPGYIEKEEIEKVLNEEILFDLNLKDKNEKPKSPGMKYKHYSPKCNIIIVDGKEDEIFEKISSCIQDDIKNNISFRVLTRNDFPEIRGKKVIGKNNEEIAHNLFEVFRELDECMIEKAYFPNIRGKLSFAIMDRVKKASGYNII